MPVSIKKDVSESVRLVENLSKALEILGQTAQRTFSNLGQLTEAFGQSVSGAAAKTQGAIDLATPSDFLTATGQKAGISDVAQLAKDSWIQQQMQLDPGDPQRMLNIDQQGHMSRVRGRSQFGVFTESMGTVSDFERRSSQRAASARAAEGVVKDRAQNRAQALDTQSEILTTYHRRGVPGVASEDMMIAGRQNAERARQIRGIGYSLADVPGALSMQGKLGGTTDELGKAIEGLTKSNDQRSQDAANVLTQLRDDIKSNNQQFNTAMQQFRATSHLSASNPERQRAEQEVVTALGNLQSSVDESTKATRESSQLPGGPGGGEGGRPGLLGRLRSASPASIAAGLGAAAGTVGAGALMYQSAGIALGSMAADARIRQTEALGGVAEKEFQRTLASQDMTRAENIMRFRGDMLFPSSMFRYLGREGVDRSREDSMRAVQMQLDVARQERNRTITQTVTGVAPAAVGGAMLGFGLLTGGAGIAMMGAGALAMGLPGAIGTLGGGTQQYIQNRYTAHQGGLDRGAVGMMGRAKYGEKWGGMARDITYAERLMTELQVENYMDQLQTAELKRWQPQITALGETRDMIQAQKRVVPAVGPYTVTYRDLWREEYAPYGEVDQRVVSARQRKSRLKEWEENPNLQFSDQAVAGGLRLSKERDRLRAQLENDRRAQAQLSVINTGMGRLGMAGYKDPKIERRIKKTQNALAELDIPLVLAPRYMEQALEDVPSFGRGSAVESKNAARRNLADTTLSRLELTGAEYIMHNAQFVSAMGMQRRATMGEVSKMVRFGRGGLGDYGQLMGNLATVQQVVGRGESRDVAGPNRLRNVMMEAVAAGFDTSRVAQSFFRTTSELVKSLGMNRMSGMAAQLSFASKAMGAGFAETGLGDEASMAAAARGIMQYGQYTKQTGGLVGATKLYSLMGSGVDFSSGLGLLQGMSAPETQDLLKQLEPGQKITSIRLQNVLNSQEGVSPEEARQRVRGYLKSAHRGATGPLKGFYQFFNRRSFEDDVSNVIDSQGDKKKFTEAVLKLRAGAANFGAMTQVGEEGAMAFAMEEVSSRMGPSDNKSEFLRLMRQRERTSLTAFEDPANIALRRFRETLIADMAKTSQAGMATSKATMDLYTDYLGSEGSPWTIGRFGVKEGESGFKYQGEKISDEALRKNRKIAEGGGAGAARAQAWLSEAERTIRGGTELDLLSSVDTEMSARQQGTQKVHVINFNEITSALINVTKQSDANAMGGFWGIK